jgi:oxygen-independent coproporphyrinogen-3 oxidase
MIRELVLQLKLGSVQPSYFAGKYGVDILDRFREQLSALKTEGYLDAVDKRVVALSRRGLLRVDALLPRFFLPQHVGIRYA